MWLLVAIAVAAFVGSILATQLLIAIEQRRALRSSVLDLIAFNVGILSLQLWAAHDNDWRLLEAEAIGAALGTGLIVWLNRRRGK